MSPPKDYATTLSARESVAWIAGFLQGMTGVLVRSDVPTFINSRLRPVLRQHGLKDIRELQSVLAQGDPILAADTIDSLTTHETSFNRDLAVFTWLKEHGVPELLAHLDGTRPLCIWSAGCATGEEALSVAMILASREPEPAWSIWATDISAPTVKRASEGIFSAMQVNRGLRARQLMRWFSRKGISYRASDMLMRRIIWKTHNLIQDPPPASSLDLVLLRNVLIYFNTADRQRALDCVNAALRPGGLLIVGGAENMMACIADGPFDRITQGSVTLWRKH